MNFRFSMKYLKKIKILKLFFSYNPLSTLNFVLINVLKFWPQFVPNILNEFLTWFSAASQTGNFFNI